MELEHYYTFNEHINANFDVSVIMPFYKKMAEFQKVFPINYKCFERNGIEVVIVLDSSDEKDELLAFVKQYPFINWKIIINENPHEWRNPAKPLNVGLRYATKKYVMVCSPESEFMTDAILQLREALNYYPNHYAIGTVCFANEDDIITSSNLDKFEFIPFGSIMVEKKHLFDINGYDESFSKWGGDDNNIRARLEMIGVEELLLPEVVLIHRDIDNEEGKKRRAYIPKEIPTEASRHFFSPNKAIANNKSWGQDFDKVLYDWENNIYGHEFLKEYVKKFDKSFLKEDMNNNEHEILLLAQSYNEENNIEEYLKAMSSLFDGIILLDDGSSDSTYEKTIDEKLLVKVKKSRENFNDLLNRNILLNLASFFKHSWICFIDLDERFDKRFSNLRELIRNSPKADSFIFNLIQLWDKETTYNTEYPASLDGVSMKFRMFKNIGRSQIRSEIGKLHFTPIPYFGKVKHVPILIKHYGNLTKSMRINKYNFYQQEDTEHCQVSYEHLLADNPTLKDVATLKDTDLKKVINYLF